MESDKLLRDYSNQEKGAYLGAIASIATADRSASEEELEALDILSDSAGLSETQKAAVRRAATEMSEDELKRCLEVLKGSDLRFSLVADLIAFGEADQNYTAEEKAQVEKIASFLNINKQQFSLLDEFVHKTGDEEVPADPQAQQQFLGSTGLQDKFRSAGINSNGLLKGLLGIAAPMILAGMLSRGMRGGGFGGGLGGMLGGGLGGMLGGGMMGGGMGGMRRGGFGSLINVLNGGRGFRSTGGLFGRMLRGY